MNEEYNLTIQEFLYKKSGADHFVHIDENNFEEIKDEMVLSKDEPGNYYLEVDTDRYFKNYAAYCIIDSKGKGAGNIFRADMKPIINFNQGEKLYLYNCRAFTESTKKLSSNAREILGIVIMVLIFAISSFLIGEQSFKAKIAIVPFFIIAYYQIGNWLIPNFTDKISLKKDDYQKALYVSYTIGQNDKELEINVRNKRDKYYEEKRKKDEICAPKAKELSDKFLDIKLKKMDLSNSLTTYLNNIYPFITPIEYFNIKSQIQDLKDIFPEEYYKFIFQYEDLKDIANIPDDQLIFNNKFYLQIENQFVKQNYIPTQYTLTQAIHLLYNIKLRINDNYGLLDKEKSFYTNLDKVTEYSIFSHHTRQSFLSAIDINADFFQQNLTQIFLFILSLILIVTEKKYSLQF